MLVNKIYCFVQKKMEVNDEGGKPATMLYRVHELKCFVKVTERKMEEKNFGNI